MSDAAIGGSGTERRRTLASILVAAALHAGILALVSLAAGLGMPLPATTQTVIDVQLESAPVAAEPVAAEPAPAGQPSEAPSLPPQADASPAAASKAPKAGAGTGSASDFVIPTPRGQTAASQPTARVPAFQESGSKTGVAAGLPAVQNQLPQPDVAVAPQGKGGSSAAASAGTVQRSGEGTLLQGQPGKGSAGSLDLSQLDKSIASGAGGTSGAAAAKGGTGTGQSGTGSGQGAGGGGGGAGGSGLGNYRVDWDQPDASRGRTLVFVAKPRIPAWVSAQGLTLSVKVAFTLTPDGVIGAVSVMQSTAYADVDSAVLDAIRLCLFTQSKGAGMVRGVFTYVVKPQ